MTRLAKLQKRANKRVQRIWQGLVQLVNADSGEFTSKFQKQAQSLVFDCLEWSTGLVEDDLSIFEDVARQSERQKDETIEDAFLSMVARYLPDIRAVLAWLSSPDKEKSLAQQAVYFLQKHSAGVEWSLGIGNEDFDESGDHGQPVLFWPELNRCESIAGPICKFLAERMWRFQEGELSLIEAIPIRKCDRVGCSKFKLPKRRKNRCFCSAACRSADYQSNLPLEFKRKKMRDYRKVLAQMSGIAAKSQGRPARKIIKK
jgi:hypothetical protein